MSDEEHKSKAKVDELDLVKFQLLTSYLGMAKQKVQSVADNKSRCEAELELFSFKEKEAAGEADRISSELNLYYNELRKKYGMEGEDKLNFATGEITRMSEIHGLNKTKKQENQKEGKEV